MHRKMQIDDWAPRSGSVKKKARIASRLLHFNIFENQ